MLSKTNKNIILTVYSIFFIIAIGVHIYEPIIGSAKSIWWHVLYIITYSTCWGMLFSKNANRQAIFGVAGLFPFSTHFYYGYQHLSALDSMFWVCVLVCALLVLGFIFIEKHNIISL
jgi:hypothetical protein